MHILITNDDGVNAKGINELVKVAMQYGRVTVVAPNECYSGMSHSITMHRPLFVDHITQSEPLNIYSCTGSPVDCVKVALDELLVHDPVDILLSGINHGSNANISVIYSGTMGAATEGSLYGIPAVGFSLTDHDLDANFEPCKEYVAAVIEMVIGMPDSERRGLCLNVNFPNVEQIKGMRFCRQTRGNWREEFVPHADPRGRKYYWMSGAFCNDEPEAEDSDEWVLGQGYVSIVPVKVDFTDYSRLNALTEKFQK